MKVGTLFAFRIFQPPAPAPAWTVDTRQDGFILSCCLRQILTQPSATCFQSSFVRFRPACVHCILTFLFLADRSRSCCLFYHLDHSPLTFLINKALFSVVISVLGWQKFGCSSPCLDTPPISFQPVNSKVHRFKNTLYGIKSISSSTPPQMREIFRHTVGISSCGWYLSKFSAPTLTLIQPPPTYCTIRLITPTWVLAPYTCLCRMHNAGNSNGCLGGRKVMGHRYRK